MSPRRVALTLLICACGFATSLACPFCLAPPQTFSEQFQLSDFVVVAEFVKFDVLGKGTLPLATFRCREILSALPESLAQTPNLKPGAIIQRSAEATGQPGDLYLIYGDLLIDPAIPPADTASPRTFVNESGKAIPPIRNVSLPAAAITPAIDWTDHTAISPVAAKYLKTLPSRDLPVQQRLEWYVRHLESPDPLVAGDAWAEFGCAAYEDVRACRRLYSPERLKSWVSDPGMSPERLGLYGLMLGLCGSPEDAAVLRSQCFNADTGEFRFGAEGLVAGYLLLSGEAGLSDVEQQFLQPETSSSARHALLQTLDFFHTYEPDLIPQARICQSARLLLHDPVLAETTVMSLARWRDWDSLPLLTQIFDEALKSAPPAENDSLLRSITQFAQLCSKASPTTSGLKPQETEVAGNQSVPQSRLADEFLARIAANHPELVKPRESPFQPPAPQ